MRTVKLTTTLKVVDFVDGPRKILLRNSADFKSLRQLGFLGRVDYSGFAFLWVQPYQLLKQGAAWLPALTAPFSSVFGAGCRS